MSCRSDHRPTGVRVSGLKVDYLDRPLSLENSRPHFSWRLESDQRNVQQAAYRILVSTNKASLEAEKADLWDSGKIESSQCLSIPYQGAKLHSRQRCWWRVNAWDEGGDACESSDPNWWEMGLLSPADWIGQWLAVDDAIAQADRETSLQWMWSKPEHDRGEEVRLFRVIFSLPAATWSGVLFVVGKSFERVRKVWLDGATLAPSFPGHDPTRENIAVGALTAGEHELTIEIERKCPWPEMYFQPPSAAVALFARFNTTDGRAVRIVSDEKWQTSMDSGRWGSVLTSPLKDHVIVDPAMHLRRTFQVGKTVAQARLYATALGCYEARINGKRVGDAFLTPEVSQYEKRVLYQAYDVTALIEDGANAIGLTVGDGWYASHPGRFPWGPPPRRVMAQLEVAYADATREVIATDSTWRLSRSPIQQSELVFGEIYDARLEQSKWDTAGFDCSLWQPVRLAEAPRCRLVAQASPAIRVTQILKPRAITSPLPDVYVFDFGQNFAGWCRLRVRGRAGTRVDISYGEQIHRSGEIDQFSMNGRKAADTYFLRGAPAGETFEPHFTYHGFRYVQVSGLPTVPSSDTLEGVVVHSDLPFTGNLRVDHPLLEKLWHAIVWTQRSNFIAVGTDCCNRAERMGYFMDMGIFWDTATFNMDVAAFTRRQMDNARDHQYATGAFAPLAPAPSEWIIYRAADGTATPGWSDGVVILAWTSWRRYGDMGVLEQNWEAMARHLQFILDHNPNYLWLKGRGPDFGDWLAIGEEHFMRPETPPTTPLDLFATAHWARSAQLLAEMADALTRREEARQLRAIRDRVREAFINAYVAADGKVGNGSQTSQLLALKFDLVPHEIRHQAIQHLVDEIRRRGEALSTGTIGTQYLLDVLADAGFVDLAYTLLLRREYPSWGYMIDHGATTLWERWDGALEKRHVTASHNHFALGSVGSFLFRRLAGIEESAPGFQGIRVRPLLDPRIKRGGGDYDSVMGRISTDWEQNADGRFILKVTIPGNCKATIHLPAGQSSLIQEGGEDVARRNDLRVSRRYEDEAVLEVGSGKYFFVVDPRMHQEELSA